MRQKNFKSDFSSYLYEIHMFKEPSFAVQPLQDSLGLWRAR